MERKVLVFVDRLRPARKEYEDIASAVVFGRAELVVYIPVVMVRPLFLYDAVSSVAGKRPVVLFPLGVGAVAHKRLVFFWEVLGKVRRLL